MHASGNSGLGSDGSGIRKEGTPHMRKFKTESKKLLDLMINSIYTNHEIFLRELISNASDAIDKLYFKGLTDTSVEVSKDDLEIFVSFDHGARTIVVSDNGIGMTKDELDKNLGTIAHSDSMAFKAENADSQGDDIDIIGQFGVGFYSSFMVASSVRVVSRAYGSDEAWAWESDGIEGYTVEGAERSDHGTDVILTIKESTADVDFDRFLSSGGLESLIKKYSNYVRYPVRMKVKRQIMKPRPENAGDDYQPEFEERELIDTINSMVPIWKRSKSEVSQEDYNEFYKSDFHDFADPARTITIRAEGTLAYDALLFIPSRAPYDQYTRDFKKGLALYSSNVLIMDKCEDLLPDCFNFVRGVVDSQDLTLNISRETLQQNSQLRAIARKVEKKVKSDLASMRDDDREAYEKFFGNFGRSLKFGLYSSYGQQADLLADLLLFYSGKEKKLVTLDEYVDAMPADQKEIYYAAGESLERLSQAPITTTIIGRGYDVLLCTEDVDEFALGMLHQYRDHELKNVASGDLGLETEEEKQEAEELEKSNEALFSAMKDALGDKVVKVAVSTRLSNVTAALTTEGPVSIEMERVLSSNPNAGDVKSQRVLEVNTKSPVFATMQKAHEDGDADKVRLYTEILYNQALLFEGLPLDDPMGYAQAVAKLMV